MLKKKKEDTDVTEIKTSVIHEITVPTGTVPTVHEMTEEHVNDENVEDAFLT